MNQAKTGIAALPALLLIGGIVIEIAIVSAALTFIGITNALSVRAAAEALFLARAGAQDAIMRVVRDKNFSSSGYTVPVGSRSATVVVTKDQPQAGQTTITATSSVVRRQKEIQAVVTIDGVTGQSEIVSFKEQ